MKRKLEKAFTLVEGLVVLFILGIIATFIAIVVFVIHHFW